MDDDKQLLVDLVMDQMEEDFRNGDPTGIYDLLFHVPSAEMKRFLSEERVRQLNDKYTFTLEPLDKNDEF